MTESDDKPLTELDSVPGDVIEHGDGNRFLALPNGTLAFIGNKDSRLDGLITKRSTYCKILRRIQLPEYRLPNAPVNMEDDWDAIRGVTRFRAPLPKGCSCTHDVLEQVLKCQIHRIRAEATFVSNSIMVGTAGLSLDAYDEDMVVIPQDDDDDIDEL